MGYGTLLCVAALILGCAGALAQPPKEATPAAGVVADLLKKEPFTLDCWPGWRERLLAWMPDRNRRADPAYDAARDFMKAQAGAEDQLPPALANDAIAWYFLGSYYVHNKQMLDPIDQAFKAEKALRKSLDLNPKFARSHRNLALAILHQETPGQPPVRAAEIDSELREAAALDADLPLNYEKGEVALRRQRFDEAETYFRLALKDYPDEPALAIPLAFAIVQNTPANASRSARIKDLLDRYPANGELACVHGVALALDNNAGAAYRELQRARALGVDPAKVLPPQVVRQIDEHGAPSLLERFGWIMLYFAVFYAVVMAVMSLAGLLLAGQTRGSRALGLLEASAEHLVAEGQVIRAPGETLLARIYAIALMAGLVLFYVSIPFVIAGLLGATALLVYLIFLGGRIPIKLVVIIIVFGLGAAWSVVKSLFSRPAAESFGIPKTASDCPRLHQVITEVAKRVDTDPADEVIVGPGSEIGVRQEGRGPFGVFGVKSRVLVLGLAAVRLLTVAELKSILAHEYAHFSHRDTFYGRFIYQVHHSIGQALWGMGQAGGYLNYVNPFYWFLYLYYQSYSLLSAGFSRSREFLADRMASSLYGSDVFTDALIRASTDAARAEKSIWTDIVNEMAKQEPLPNMYAALDKFADEQSDDERAADYQKLMGETGSLFAQHPTTAERLEAVADLPMADRKDETPAVTLFSDPQAIEEELTRFTAEYVAVLQHMQAQATAQAGQ